MSQPNEVRLASVSSVSQPPMRNIPGLILTGMISTVPLT